MNLTRVANQAAIDAGNAVGVSFSGTDVERVTAIIAKAMEAAVREASEQHSTVCADCCMSYDKDLAHKLQKEIDAKKIALIANLSSLR